MTQRRDFARRIDALDAVVAFTDTALAATGLDKAARQTVHFTIEELFTNMVKYASTGAPRITIEIETVGRDAAVTLIDRDVDRFDPTTARDAQVRLPIAQREPGGLGLHLARRLAESIHYEYDTGKREGRTSFRVHAAGSPSC